MSDPHFDNIENKLDKVIETLYSLQADVKIVVNNHDNLEQRVNKLEESKEQRVKTVAAAGGGLGAASGALINVILNWLGM